MLPALLDTYNAYGRCAAGSSSCENHICINGLVVATTQNGNPIATSMRPSIHGIGFDSVGGLQPCGTAIGSTTSGSSSNTR